MQCDHTHFARRESSGLVVDLYWDPADVSHEFRVQVVEHGAGFALFPPTGRTALEAFHHPFASRLPTCSGATAAPLTTKPEVL